MALFVRGLVAAYCGQDDEACEAYSEAIRQSVDSGIVYSGRADAKMRMGKRDEARVDLETAHRRQPSLACVRSKLAALALARHDWAEVHRLGDVSEGDRSSVASFEIGGIRHLAKLKGLVLLSLCRRGDSEAALWCLGAARIDVDHELASLAAALAKAVVGDHAGAAESLRFAIELNDNVVGQVNEREMELITQLHEDNPSSFAPAFVCAIRPAYDGDHGKAIVRLKQLGTRFPDEARIWTHLGRLARLRKADDEAKAAYLQAVTCDAEAREAWRSLCDLLADDEDVEGLLGLAAKTPADTLALELAFVNTVERGEPCGRIARRLTRAGGGRLCRVSDLVRLTESSELDNEDLKLSLRNMPALDFESRDLVSAILLERGLVQLARKEYEGLMTRQCTSPGATLRFALACLRYDTETVM